MKQPRICEIKCGRLLNSIIDELVLW